MVQLMSNLAQSDTSGPVLPQATAEAGTRPSLARSSATATFVSQLIAARAQMPGQRARRIGTPEGAVGAYGQTARLCERRMPAGFRKTLVV